MVTCKENEDCEATQILRFFSGEIRTTKTPPKKKSCKLSILWYLIAGNPQGPKSSQDRSSEPLASHFERVESIKRLVRATSKRSQKRSRKRSQKRRPKRSPKRYQPPFRLEIVLNEGGSGGEVKPTQLREEETAQLLPSPETTGKHTSSISLNPHLSHGDVRELL